MLFGLSGTQPATTPPPTTTPPPPTPPPTPNLSTPYTGTPIAIPGAFEAENFDKGGEGIAYHDTTPGNQGANTGSAKMWTSSPPSTRTAAAT